MNSLSESWTIVETCVQELRPLVQQAVATDDVQKYADAASQMATKLLILKAACARGREQSLDIQRVAAAAPAAKRQATDSAVASAARPKQLTEPGKLTMSAPATTTPQATGQPPQTSADASKRPSGTDDEHTASVSHQSPVEKQAQAGACDSAGEPFCDDTKQAQTQTMIDLNEPATNASSSVPADAATALI